MSIGYSVSGSLVETFLLGKVTVREVGAALEAARASAGLGRPWRLLIDASAVHALPTKAEMPQIVDIFAALAPDLDRDCALVVPEGKAAYLAGVALRAQAAKRGFDLGVYRDRAKAVAWLNGVDADGGP